MYEPVIDVIIAGPAATNAEDVGDITPLSDLVWGEMETAKEIQFAISKIYTDIVCCLFDSSYQSLSF